MVDWLRFLKDVGTPKMTIVNALQMLKGNVVLTLFKSKFQDCCSGVHPTALGRELKLNSEYNRNKWGFTVKEQSEGVGGRKITKRRHRGRDSSQTDLRGFLLKAG